MCVWEPVYPNTPKCVGVAPFGTSRKEIRSHVGEETDACSLTLVGFVCLSCRTTTYEDEEHHRGEDEEETWYSSSGGHGVLRVVRRLLQRDVSDELWHPSA